MQLKEEKSKVAGKEGGMVIHMYEKAGYCGALCFLGCLAVYDIKWKKIPVVAVLIFGLLSVLYFAAGKQRTVEYAVYCMLPGMLLLLLSLVTKEKIGYGDGAAVLILGFWTGALFCAEAVSMGIIMSGIYSLYRIIRKNNQPIPFLPFLLTAVEVILIYE